MTETLIFYLVGSLMPALSLQACGLALSQIWKGHPRLPGRRKMLGAWALLSAVCGLLIPLKPPMTGTIYMSLFLVLGLFVLCPQDRKMNRDVLVLRLAGESLCAGLLWVIHSLDPAYTSPGPLLGLFAMGQVFNCILICLYVLYTLQKRGRKEQLGFLWTVVSGIGLANTIVYSCTLMLAYRHAPVPERLVWITYLATLLLQGTVLVFFWQKSHYDQTMQVLRLKEEADMQKACEQGLVQGQIQMESLRQRCLKAIQKSLDRLDGKNTEEALDILKQLSEAFSHGKPSCLTPVPALNAMLAQKQADCRDAKATLEIQAVFKDCSEQTVLDLCIVCGNLLDNALRAVSVLEESRRKIVFSIQEIQNCLIIRTCNDWDPARAEEIRQSGCGHQILSRLAERYQGSFSAGAADGSYEAQMILPLPGSQTAVSRMGQVIRAAGSA